MLIYKFFTFLLLSKELNAFRLSHTNKFKAKTVKSFAFNEIHDTLQSLIHHSGHTGLENFHQSILLAAEETNKFLSAPPGPAPDVVPDITAKAAEVSIYSKVDKTGFIGGIASGIEQVIVFFHELLNKVGIKNSYGFSIIFFTILGFFFLKYHTIPFHI